jgi:hypoxanthine phosphoribosyltransferase
MDKISKSKKTKKHIKCTYLTWDNIMKDCRKISKVIKEKYPKCSGLYPIPRGGLVPAVIISNIINKPIQKELDSTSIVIDDIEDSGQTLMNFKDNSCVVLVSKNEKTNHYCCRKAMKNEWIYFPWEM